MKDQLKGKTKITKTKISIAEKIGNIRRFPLENVWRPKLLMMKAETLENIIYDSLCASYEHWLNTDFGNKPDPGFLLFQLQRNLKDAAETAWKKFTAERR
jgi:hypothetical protein